MAIKGYSVFPKVPALLEHHHQIVYHIQDTRCGCSRCILQPQFLNHISILYHIMSQRWFGNNDNEGVTPHSQELQNWSRFTRYSLVWYTGQSLTSCLMHIHMGRVRLCRRLSLHFLNFAKKAMKFMGGWKGRKSQWPDYPWVPDHCLSVAVEIKEKDSTSFSKMTQSTKTR